MTDALRALFARKKLTETAIKKIEEIRSSPPARRIRSGGGNVCVRYASKKMGRVIQAESQTVEMPAIVMMEHDPGVLEFYDQPTSLKLGYSHPTGRKRSHLSTPDFLVISESYIGFEEWKPIGQLEKLYKENPYRYTREGEVWLCPPGQEAAAKLGLDFRVRTDQDVDPMVFHNTIFLQDYFDEMPMDHNVKTLVLEAFQGATDLSLAEVIRILDGRAVDTLYRMIVKGDVYVDLKVSRLSDPQGVRVYRDKTIAQALRHCDQGSMYGEHALGISLNPGTLVSWDGQPWTIANVGLVEISLVNQASQLVHLPNHALQKMVGEKSLVLCDPSPKHTILPNTERIANAHPDMLMRAQKRFDAILPLLNPERGQIRKSPESRTLRRWLKQYRDAATRYGNGFVGLLPAVDKRGNRIPRLSEKVFSVMREIIDSDYLTPRSKTIYASYTKVVGRCQTDALAVPSYKTFSRAIKMNSVYERTRRRKGDKAAYKFEMAQGGRSDLSQRGTRPFEMAHIDHTEIDLELASEFTGKPIGRAWLTLMIDEYSRRILAFYLTFDPPSYRSCMAVLRECVKTYSRLPDNIIVDNGREFESIYFEAILSRCGVHKRNRPPAKPRFGSPCERMFGTINTTFIDNLLGNTQSTKNVRELTKETNPKRLVTWTFSAFNEALHSALYKYYDNHLHSIGASPKEMFEAGIAKAGIREVRYISYDRDFYLLTLPSTRKGTARVQPGVGVKINYLYYWCDGFRSPEWEYKQIPVKYDPFDLSTAYVHIHGVWTECKSEYAYFYTNKNERLLQSATAEMLRLKSLGNRRLQVNATSIMQHISELEATESLLLERFKSVSEGHASKIFSGSPLGDNGNLPYETSSTQIFHVDDMPLLEEF